MILRSITYFIIITNFISEIISETQFNIICRGMDRMRSQELKAVWKPYQRFTLVSYWDSEIPIEIRIRIHVPSLIKWLPFVSWMTFDCQYLHETQLNRTRLQYNFKEKSNTKRITQRLWVGHAPFDTRVTS